ncbi:hypothetical protein O0I10_000469 [Lichtheimia ornata]|uniref:GATA-type domain-containing protein n=1 Tax=Lichtheimia ornata TaxID=688661 RepID=A0AAD7Y5L4_9FUNG|nr:uncharacterized protein O0I10_000469 [Lichtheimia ornata]KAJ8664190.1 hypothetical protein O0I10_000469 [Lichtheimia ornata]
MHSQVHYPFQQQPHPASFPGAASSSSEPMMADVEQLFLNGLVSSGTASDLTLGYSHHHYHPLSEHPIIGMAGIPLPMTPNSSEYMTFQTSTPFNEEWNTITKQDHDTTTAWMYHHNNNPNDTLLLGEPVIMSGGNGTSCEVDNNNHTLHDNDLSQFLHIHPSHILSTSALQQESQENVSNDDTFINQLISAEENFPPSTPPSITTTTSTASTSTEVVAAADVAVKQAIPDKNDEDETSEEEENEEEDDKDNDPDWLLTTQHTKRHVRSSLSSSHQKKNTKRTSPGSRKKATPAPPLLPNHPDGIICCTNCETTNTPLWRRNPKGEPLCNACGLFLKLHGMVRPLSLKTDVIKKRNRSRGGKSRSTASSSSSSRRPPPRTSSRKQRR